jgi:hypothetical protein
LRESDDNCRLEKCKRNQVLFFNLSIIQKIIHPNFESNSLPVYNCAAGKKCQITIQQMLDIGIHGIVQETAMEHMIWKADGGVTLNKINNFVRVVFFQIIPAIILDFGLNLKKQKPR